MSTLLLSKKSIDRMGKSVNEATGSAVSSFARRQMEKMGWQEGKGLGKNEDGMSTHIKQKKKDDNAGLGVDKTSEFAVDNNLKGGAKTSITGGNDNWWHDAFASTLKSLNKKGKKRSKKEGSDAPPTMEELFAATGGARLGMRARADQPGKFARAERDVNSVGGNIVAKNESKSGEGEGGGEGGGEEEVKEKEKEKKEKKKEKKEKKNKKHQRDEDDDDQSKAAKQKSKKEKSHGS